MAKELVIGGVPASILTDAWWLSADGGAGDGRGPAEAVPARRRGQAALALAALVALADILFYRQSPGLSLALFAVAVFAAAALTRPPASARTLAGPGLLLVASALPVAEHLQPLSAAFLIAGLLASTVWIALGDGAPRAILAGAGALVRLLPWKGAADLGAASRAAAAELRRDGLARRVWRGWAFPAGGVLVLATLLIDANPVLSGWLDRLTGLAFRPDEWVVRIGFWLGTGLLVWPLLAAAADRALLLRAPRTPALPRLPGLGVNSASVTNALIAFNLVLLVQTLLDALYLWGGAALPEGVSHAEYAHRGAYPLLATALLAGGFALASRPFIEGRQALRALLMLWLGQNVLLVLSAAQRLAVYVDSYGLTYLRLHAAIWMGLVAAGLVLTGWQIWRGRSNLWLLLRSAGLGLAVLYACAFVNFAHVIAAHNLGREAGRALDGHYVCSLGPTATAALAADPDAYLTGGAAPGDETGVRTVLWRGCTVATPVIEGWRDWGFRNWRVRRYLDETASQPEPAP